MPSTARTTEAPAGLASDIRSLDALKGRAASDPKGAVRAVSKQFEALFMQELMKSMRSSTLASGLLDNEGGKLGTEMLDQQLSTQMTGLPGGLSDAIARQLERQMGMAPGPIPNFTPPARPASLAPLGSDARPIAIPQRGAAAFVQQHTAAAQQAEATTGIPAAFMVAQAAHESGWGRKEILHPDGSPSHNLFGIKAGAGWNGPVAEVRTTEYIDGQPRSVTARFRAYASHAESFADYARLMKDNPRYRPAVAQAQADSAAGFAQGLQQGGYATDPAYADKLTRIINTTLRLQRSTS